MTTAVPVVLAILDGWGVAPPSKSNPLDLKLAPTLARWERTYPHTTIVASGPRVGLDVDQDGNSEAGHMNIGAGRVVPQDDMRVSQSINDGTFFRNPAFAAAIHHVQKHHSTLHLVGMLGNTQSAHANPDHLLALLILAQNARLRNIRLHLSTDGRDSPRYYAREILGQIAPHLGDVKVGTIMGRYFSMDRNKNWERTEKAYRAVVEGQAEHHADDALAAITQAYNREESDEFIQPTVIGNYQGLSDGDAIIHFNLRSDRARQLTKAFVQPDFETRNAATKCFTRQKVVNQLTFVAMTEFGPDLGAILTAYPAVQLTETLPFAMARRRQLYVAESEKYAHVTYFLNGGYADPVAGESRLMVPSPNVPTYDLTPAMSSGQITDRVCDALARDEFDFIVLNFANLDMVAHTGDRDACRKAFQSIDQCLGRLSDAMRARDGILIVTADHGNAEELLNSATGEVDTEHSTNPVPFYVISNRPSDIRLRADGALCDVAPTVLELAQVPQPVEMTGRSLLLKPE